MSDNKAFKSEKSGNIITPKCRLVWPALLTPTGMKGEPEDKKKFSATLLIPKGADYTAMKEAAAAAAADKFGAKATKLRSPFRETKEKDSLAAYADDYPFYVTARSKDRPGVVLPSNVKTDDPEEIYGGRWVKASVQAFGYDTSGNKGVSFGLINVQLLDHDDPIATSRVAADREFEPIDFAGGDGGENKSAESVFG
jgi:hypothetical protein